MVCISWFRLLTVRPTVNDEVDHKFSILTLYACMLHVVTQACLSSVCLPSVAFDNCGRRCELDARLLRDKMTWHKRLEFRIRLWDSCFNELHAHMNYEIIVLLLFWVATNFMRMLFVLSGTAWCWIFGCYCLVMLLFNIIISCRRNIKPILQVWNCYSIA